MPTWHITPPPPPPKYYQLKHNSVQKQIQYPHLTSQLLLACFLHLSLHTGKVFRAKRIIIQSFATADSGLTSNEKMLTNSSSAVTLLNLVSHTDCVRLCMFPHYQQIVPATLCPCNHNANTVITQTSEVPQTDSLSVCLCMFPNYQQIMPATLCPCNHNTDTVISQCGLTSLWSTSVSIKGKKKIKVGKI